MSLPVEIVTVRLEQRVSGEAWFGFWGRFRRDLDPRTVFASGFSGLCTFGLLLFTPSHHGSRKHMHFNAPIKLCNPPANPTTP